MIRSRKKFPMIKDRDSKSKDYQREKKFANRAVRRCHDMPSGKAGFKRAYYIDYNYRYYTYLNEKELKRAWDNGSGDNVFYNSYQEALQDWKKACIRK